MTDHVHGRPDNEEEWLDDLLGRGPGDPDFHSPPWVEHHVEPKDWDGKLYKPEEIPEDGDFDERELE